MPQMVARKRGVLIHLSSGAGTALAPLLAVYSATKAFNAFLGKALEKEYKDKGIISQVTIREALWDIRQYYAQCGSLLQSVGH